MSEQDFSAVHGPGLSISFKISHSSPQSFILTGLSQGRVFIRLHGKLKPTLRRAPKIHQQTPCGDNPSLQNASAGQKIGFWVCNFGFFMLFPQQRQQQHPSKRGNHSGRSFLSRTEWATPRQNWASVLSKRSMLMESVTRIIIIWPTYIWGMLNSCSDFRKIKFP